MIIPNFGEIRELHKKYAPNKKAFDDVWQHSQIVRHIALQVARNRKSVDINLVESGALVHDIGVYELFEGEMIQGSKAYITHGLLGYNLLKSEGVNENICRFALLHTGVGITADDIKSYSLPLPPRDYIAETEEERIVMYADKFHSKTDPPTINTINWYRGYLKDKFGAHKVALFDDMIRKFGEPDLEEVMSLYSHAVR